MSDKVEKNEKEQKALSELVRWVFVIAALTALIAAVVTIVESSGGIGKRLDIASNERLAQLPVCEKAILGEKARYGTPITNHLVRAAESECNDTRGREAEAERRRQIAFRQLEVLSSTQ